MLGISEVDGNTGYARGGQRCDRTGRGHSKCCGPASREIFAEDRQIDAAHCSSSTSPNLSRSSARRSSF